MTKVCYCIITYLLTNLRLVKNAKNAFMLKGVSTSIVCSAKKPADKTAWMQQFSNIKKQ